jgi:hypothetical protein
MKEMKAVVKELKARRKVHAAWVKGLDSLIARAEAVEGGKKAKRRRRATTKAAKPSSSTPTIVRAKAVAKRATAGGAEKPPVSELRKVLRANGKKNESVATPAKSTGRPKRASDADVDELLKD